MMNGVTLTGEDIEFFKSYCFQLTTVMMRLWLAVTDGGTENSSFAFFDCVQSLFFYFQCHESKNVPMNTNRLLIEYEHDHIPNVIPVLYKLEKSYNITKSLH